MNRPGHGELELVHVRRDVRTSLELGLAAGAPSGIIEPLAAVAGLLEALEELQHRAPTVAAMRPELLQRARSALAVWNAWNVQGLGHER
jgi:hypothetical protein